MSSNWLLRIKQALWWFLLSSAPQPKGCRFDSHKFEDVHCRSFWCASSSPPSWVHWGLLLRNAARLQVWWSVARVILSTVTWQIFPKIERHYILLSPALLYARTELRDILSVCFLEMGNDTLGSFELWRNSFYSRDSIGWIHQSSQMTFWFMMGFTWLWRKIKVPKQWVKDFELYIHKSQKSSEDIFHLPIDSAIRRVLALNCACFILSITGIHPGTIHLKRFLLASSHGSIPCKI